MRALARWAGFGRVRKGGELQMAWRVAVAMLVAGLLAWPTQSTRAQEMLQQFFGFRAPSPPPPTLYGYPGSRSIYVWPSPQPFDQPDFGRRDDLAYGRPGSYRTLCVRLCDGYYFPISSATGGGGLSRDADICSASCGSEARLFYYSNTGGDVDSMVDLMGLAYSSLPNAFLYRKTLVPECRCRPLPWSESELQRHRDYASGKAVATAPSQTPRPSPERGDASRNAARPIDRPEPFVRDPSDEPWPSASGPARSRYVWPYGR